MENILNPRLFMKEMETDPTLPAANVYEPVLRDCPVARVSIPTSAGEYWGVFGYQDLVKVLRDYRTMSSTVTRNEDGTPSILPLYADPPLHTGYRRLLNPNFTPAVVARIEDDIRAFAEEMISDLVACEHVDFFEAFASKFPTRVLCRFLGVPDEDWITHYEFNEAVDSATDSGFNNPDGFPQDVFLKFLPYIQRVIADHRLNFKEDIVGSFVVSEIDGRPLEDREIVQLIVALMLAGHGTTTAALSNFVLRIASDPELQATLRADPSRIGDALEECLRIDAPQQALKRRCLVDTELSGQTIRAGEPVLTNYGSANVDPHRFPEPARFDIGRAGKGHLSFGQGLHQCLGQHLARLDMRIAVETLLQKTVSITLDGPVKRRTYPVLAAVELPLRLVPS